MQLTRFKSQTDRKRLFKSLNKYPQVLDTRG